MNILAVDSSAKAASAAVVREDDLLAYFVAENGQTHSELLLPMAENACARAGLALNEIDYYAVSVGPGSFTGVRIGVSLIKGLAFRYPKTETANCVAVSTLESLAQNLYGLDGIYCPCMDARRSEVYNALFVMQNGELTRLCPDRAISLAALAEELLQNHPDTPIRLCGDGYEIAHRALSGKGLHVPQTPSLLRAQNAASVALCARRAVARGEVCTDCELAPVYLRLPQAERDRLAREQST